MQAIVSAKQNINKLCWPIPNSSTSTMDKYILPCIFATAVSSTLCLLLLHLLHLLLHQSDHALLTTPSSRPRKYQHLPAQQHTRGHLLLTRDSTCSKSTGLHFHGVTHTTPSMKSCVILTLNARRLHAHRPDPLPPTLDSTSTPRGLHRTPLHVQSTTKDSLEFFFFCSLRLLSAFYLIFYLGVKFLSQPHHIT